MSDPRNVAHDKKVKQEKNHQDSAANAEKKPKKSRGKKAAGENEGTDTPAIAAVPQAPGDHEKSVTVLSKLKEMEFHSRANIETLAGLTLTIEDELKQKEFSDPIGGLYSAQDSFQTKIAELIERYEAKCDSLKPAS